MCGDLSDRDDFEPPPRRPDLWRERLAAEAEERDEPSAASEDDAPEDVADAPAP
jgi:hypothetical protein